MTLGCVRGALRETPSPPIRLPKVFTAIFPLSPVGLIILKDGFQDTNYSICFSLRLSGENLNHVGGTENPSAIPLFNVFEIR